MMTEYTEMVEKVRLEQELKQWSEGIKYIHTNNGVIETKYNNGDIEFLNTKTGKTRWHRKNMTEETLLNKFHQAMSDMASRTYWK